MRCHRLTGVAGDVHHLVVRNLIGVIDKCRFKMSIIPLSFKEVMSDSSKLRAMMYRLLKSVLLILLAGVFQAKVVVALI